MEQLLETLLPQVIALAKQAGDKIVAIYEKTKPLKVEMKADHTPLTEADTAAHQVIKAGLSQLSPNYPLLSEEGTEVSYDTRSKWTRYWLVDPLDGTREFINRTDEFTVNIALIQDQEAIVGIVYAPIKNLVYYGVKGSGAFKMENDKLPQKIKSRSLLNDNIVVVASRRHGVDELQSFYDKLGSCKTINMGSALKSCVVAEGRADIYPRLGLTSEWDTAAAQCVVEEAGGRITTIHGERLLYNTKPSLLNPDFMVVGDPHYDWAQYFSDKID